MMYAVIMAGGSGTRLWPRSRKSRPKQFHSLTSERSLLQETVARLEPTIDPEHVYVIANKSHVAPIREQLDRVPAENIIGEPVARNTAPAIGIMATILAEKDPNAIMLVLPADHYIEKADDFRQLLELAERTVSEDDFLLTLGIKPTYPETGFGYIELASEYREVGEEKIFWVKSFKEKPDLDTAQKYVASWRYVWNSGMFVWKVSSILDRFKKHAPDIYGGMERFREVLGTPKEQEELAKIFKSLPSISVDYAILEKSEKVLVIPADIGWSDIGSWKAVYDLLSFDGQTNVVSGKHVGLDTYNCLIQGGNRLVATVGLDNMIVVDTDDVVLIMPKGRSQDVKKILEKLQKQGRTEYL
ncbi:MAG: mannose-1-phosphate guanylyltransferase [Armatimonadota bacterium]